MKSVAISEFRAQLPAFIAQVEGGEEIILTSRGREVARVVPSKDRKSQACKALRQLRKKARVGDVLSPIDVKWNALP